MLPNPTLDKLQTLRLHGMIKALGEQHATPDINDLSFDERLGLMVDRELTEREDARLYSAAIRDGWTADELRQLGIGEPAKKERVRRRAAAGRKSSTPEPVAD